MLNTKAILKAFGLFALLFTGLLILTHMERVEERLGSWFISSTTSFYEMALPKAAINVEHDRNPSSYSPNEVWISPTDKEWLQEQLAIARRTGQPLEIDNAASLLFKIGTFPKTALVFLLSLVLATPMDWKKKLKYLAIALFCFWVYFYLFIYLETLNHISDSRIGVYMLEGSKASLVGFLHRTFCNFGFSLTFSLIIWAITCIDFNALFAQFNTALTGQVPEAPSKPPKIKSSKKKKKKKSSK